MVSSSRILSRGICIMHLSSVTDRDICRMSVEADASLSSPLLASGHDFSSTPLRLPHTFRMHRHCQADLGWSFDLICRTRRPMSSRGPILGRKTFQPSSTHYNRNWIRIVSLQIVMPVSNGIVPIITVLTTLFFVYCTACGWTLTQL
jgi:hypothetical protein